MSVPAGQTDEGAWIEESSERCVAAKKLDGYCGKQEQSEGRTTVLCRHAVILQVPGRADSLELADCPGVSRPSRRGSDLRYYRLTGSAPVLPSVLIEVAAMKRSKAFRSTWPLIAAALLASCSVVRTMGWRDTTRQALLDAYAGKGQHTLPGDAAIRGS